MQYRYNTLYVYKGNRLLAFCVKLTINTCIPINMLLYSYNYRCTVDTFRWRDFRHCLMFVLFVFVSFSVYSRQWPLPSSLYLQKLLIAHFILHCPELSASYFILLVTSHSPHFTHASSSSSSMVLQFITSFHSRRKTYFFNNSFPP